MTKTPELLPGTLDLLILRTLQKDALHGWAISERIQQISQDVLQINQGSLYPALHRLEHQGWIDAEWKLSELGRRAKCYHRTAPRRRKRAVGARDWDRMANATGRVTKLAGPSATCNCGRARCPAHTASSRNSTTSSRSTSSVRPTS